MKPYCLSALVLLLASFACGQTSAQVQRVLTKVVVYFPLENIDAIQC
jgi:hypothetical protein